MTRGEVRWYRFANPDKRRPVLILTRDSALEYLAEVTVVPITTHIRGIPTEVALDREDGMPRRCVITLDRVQTVSKGKLGPVICNLSHARLTEVRGALLFALGF